jgi:hypothetical protein
MGRIRTVKPEFFKHEDLFNAEKKYKLPLRIAYVGLWCIADREGRFKWRPNSIKLDVLPFDSVDFDKVLSALSESGFIIKYEHEGQTYGYIPKFKDHQVINNRETESLLPIPSLSTTSTRAPHVVDACPTPLVQDQGEGKGREGVKEGKDIPPVGESESYKKFNVWLKDKAPQVCKLKDQLTPTQFDTIFAKYDKNIITDTLIQMHNWKPLLTKNISVYYTLIDWISRRK